MYNIDVLDGFFFQRITEEQAERTLWLDTLPLSVAEKFMMSLVPVSTKVPSLQRAWEQWAYALSKKRVTKLQGEQDNLYGLNLKEVEDSCRLYSAYAWLFRTGRLNISQVWLKTSHLRARRRGGSIRFCRHRTLRRVRSTTKNFAS